MKLLNVLFHHLHQAKLLHFNETDYKNRLMILCFGSKYLTIYKCPVICDKHFQSLCPPHADNGKKGIFFYAYGQVRSGNIDISGERLLKLYLFNCQNTPEFTVTSLIKPTITCNVFNYDLYRQLLIQEETMTIMCCVWLYPTVSAWVNKFQSFLNFLLLQTLSKHRPQAWFGNHASVSGLDFDKELYTNAS